MGAMLFGTPHVKGGIRISGLVSVVLIVGVALVGLMLVRGSRSGPSDPNPGDDWRKGPPPPDPPPPDRPRGGIPLDDAAPARVRLRDEARLADKLPGRVRRPAHEPLRVPVRRPGRVPVRDTGAGVR